MLLALERVSEEYSRIYGNCLSTSSLVWEVQRRIFHVLMGLVDDSAAEQPASNWTVESILRTAMDGKTWNANKAEALFGRAPRLV